MSDNISKLYQELKGTYELGSENDFRKYLSDGKKREALRKELEADYEVGDSASFTKYLGLEAKPKPYNQSEDSVGARVGAAVFQKPQQRQSVASQPSKPQPIQMPQGFGQLDIQQANQMGMGKGPVSWEQPEMPDHQETVVEKQQRMLQGKATPQEHKQVQNRLQQRKDEIAYEEETGKRLRQPVLNTDFEAPTLARDEYGNIRRDENGNPLIGNTTDQDRVSAHQQVMAEQAEWDSLSDKEKRERMKQMQLQREMDEYEEPGFLGVTGKKLASGFINAGVGLLKTLDELASGMIVEDASSPSGYSRVPDFDPNANDPITSGIRSAGEYAEQLSRQGEPRKGASFTDLLMSGDISGFLLKGWGTGMESAPMTLSAYNPYTMALNAISMAGNNYWQETMENPDVPSWKRASYAIGTAAIEQAVEKFADPVFKYIGGGMGKKVAQKVTEEAEKTIAKRIVDVLKDAAGEGAEEIITNFGNDTLGQALDWLDGASDYGLVAQWRDYKKQNPNASLSDFAFQKADETMNSFFGGALAGAYTSGGAQATVAGLQYAIGRTASPEQIMSNPNQPVHPATLDIAQSFDRGYGLEKDEDKHAAADKYSAYRSRMEAAVGEEVLNKIDSNPTQALADIDQYGLDEEGQRILGEYIGAKAAYDGVQQRIIEDNRASRPNYVVNGNNIDEVDAEGNVVNTHEYANAEEMKAGLWELQARRDYMDMQADINMARLNPRHSYDSIIGDFAEQTGLDVDYIESILNKDPLELSDPESALVSEFAEVLHSALYDNTEVHEEQSTQDGAKLADAMSIDINDISEENAAQAQQLTNELNAAQQALNDAFAQNEDLRQEVEFMEKQGMPHQGIIGALNTFRPNEVQAVIDFYNATAKFEGFRNQMANKINEEAANSTKRHTLNGTINGRADLGNIYTISDGTNEYYLVSGNITTDPTTGQITGSDSGLIIGMDLDGSMVSLGDTSGYSLTPNVVSASQFEEQERIRLQEAWSMAIDPAGAEQAAAAEEQPQPTEQPQPANQSGVLDNAGGEASAANGTGANNPPASAPSETQPVQIPVDEKSGLKRYEQGVPVEQTIQDMQNDGFDVNEMSDAYIAEAQEQIDKINNKPTKKPQDLIERKRLIGIIDYYNNVKARFEELNREENVNNEPQTSQSEGNVVSSQPKLTVEEQKQERIKALKAELGELFDDDFTKANDVYELVSMWVGRKRNLAWDDVNGKRGLQKELGWTRKIGGDTKFIETLLAKKGEGMGVDEFVHMVWESPENSVNGEKRWDDTEIKEALLDLLKSAQSKSDVVDYALNTREAQARAALAEQQKQAEEEAANQTETEVVLTDEDIARMTAELPFAPPVEGEDIPESVISQLMKAVQKLMQRDGMPTIRLVDTDRMSDDEWYDITSGLYGGAFVSQEEIENVRNNALEMGVVYNEGTGEIVVFSDSQTAEDVNNKVNYIYEEITRSNSVPEEGRNNGRDSIVAGVEQETQSGEGSETPAAETESTGSPQPIKSWTTKNGRKVELFVMPETVDEDGNRHVKIGRSVDGGEISTGHNNGIVVTTDNIDYESTYGDAEEVMANDAANDTRYVVTEVIYLPDGRIKARGTIAGDKASFWLKNDPLSAQPTEQTSTPTQEDYLQPRDAEEEKIIADVLAQLQQEIQGAIDEQNKARSELQKAQARESERATDMFSDDEAFEEPGQLFSFDDMGGTDRSQEGVERRTSAERQRLQQATDKLNRLQSEQERNSRIRGALDNHRRQTSFEDTAPTREQYLADHPLTEAQIMADTEATEDEKLNAIDFLNGDDDSVISRFYYDQIYNRAQEAEAQPQPTQQEHTSDPIEAIEQAASSFREEEAARQQKRERMNETDAEREERKRQNEADIANALKEFSDFLDNAKGNGVLDKFMRKGLEGNDKAQANLLDAFTLTNEAQRMFLKDLLRLASKVGYAYIKSGVHDVQAWSAKMADGIGRKLKEVLGWDDAIVGEFVGEVWNQKYTVDGQRMRLSEHADRLKNNNVGDHAVNEHKEENNEPENVVPLQGDSAEFADRQKEIDRLSLFVHDILLQAALRGAEPAYDYETLGHVSIKTMSGVKSLAEKLGLKDMSLTDLQELVEAQIVQVAREISETESLNEWQKFQNIVRLYQNQPTLSARDNDRINKQQYSTPAPMAFLMGKFLTAGKEVKSGLEPSAGNGMLTLALPKEVMHVNDIDEMRLANLGKQGFASVTSQDGLQSFGEKQYDVVVTNPPFGSVPAKTYDGLYEISGLEHQMAINALESMKDDGRAAIIIGGNTEYNQNGTIKGKDRAFLNYLYAHYNVVDVINMNGHTLYSRQGTGYHVRMILINGRKEFNPRSFAPTIQKARAESILTYDELYKRVNDDILSDTNQSAGVHDTESGESNGKHDNGHAGASTETGVRNVQPGRGSSEHNVLDEDGRSVQLPESPTDAEGRGGRGLDANGQADSGLVPGTPVRDGVRGPETSEPDRGAASQADSGREQRRGRELSDGRDNSERPDGGADLSIGGGSRGTGTAQQDNGVRRGLSTEKVPYKKQSSNPFTLDSLMPAEQADEVKKILEELGDVDQFLVDELGYSSKEELHQALAAEQIDSVAMAIHQMNQGNAFIIGDMTGIGKGRQAAALIRYAVKKGGNPVFVTVKKALFSDMYRDLCDIGSPKLRPFIWCAKDKENSQDITDADGNVIYKWNKKEQERVVDYINKHGKLPPEYDYVVTTYDGFKSGTKDYEDGKKQDRKFGKNQKPGPSHFNGQAKRDALESLAGSSYVIMDESHNAGGDKSNVSRFLQYITVKTKGTTFLSATFAKRPENMPIYALRTAISKAGVKVDELIAAVKKGGATFQEVMSKALTGAGQMIRRERDMTGVTIDWKGIEDEDIVQKQRNQYDTIIGLFNDIIQFQRTYVDPIVNKMNDDAADEQGEVDHTPGTRDMGINNTPFASRTYNMVQQVLLSLKAEETAKRAIEHLKTGRKPVIAVANTNEGAADEVAGMGEDMEMPDLSVNLKKGLQGTLRITKKDAFGNDSNESIPFDKLSEAGQARFREIMDAIETASSGLSLSPIDVIKNTLQKAGYKVGELTGRKAEFIYNEDGTVRRVKRQDTDKKRIAANFNGGKIDALIINRSAGTGISLHASTKFKDQRQRIMIVAQAQGDVNDEVQMRGRIDRTGQVLRGMYEYVVSQIPSEQRLLMMLKAKLRSLDANTTSSQKSKFNEMQVQDIINKYGDDIVIQYLAEHADLAEKMCDPLGWGEGFVGLAPETLISQAEKKEGEGATASKVLGRMALLKVTEQEKMLAEIGDLYQAEIDRLNEMGENDLEITEMPLKAKTLRKDVWEEGVEPGGKNPFADNSYVETVEMDVLRKPMKAEEVKKAQERLLGTSPNGEGTVATWEEYKQGVTEKVDAWAEQKKADTTKTFTERAEKKAEVEKEKYAKGAKKMQDKNGMTDEEIERNSQAQYNSIRSQEMQKLDPALEAIDKQKQAFVDALETFTTDGVYALPTDIYDLTQLAFEPSFGKVIDIDIKEDNYSTAASTITFATLDGRRKITIPVSGMVKQNNGEKRDIKPIIVQQTAQARDGFFGRNIADMHKVLSQNVDNWDRLATTATRKQGYIITGNLLKALTELRKQGKGGKLISYTTDTGDVRQGILMSDQFDPKTLTSKNPISSAKADLFDWQKDKKIESADGEVEIKNDGGGWFQLKVPKSKKRGEKYFNDTTLLDLVSGQFEGSSRMAADFRQDNLDAILKRLDELGVTVQSTKEEQESINTSDPMEAIRRAAHSFRESAKDSESSLSETSQNEEPEKKSVPLERRTLKSYTDSEGNYHTGIEEEIAGLEADIARAGREDAGNREENTEVQPSRPNSGRRVNDLRREAAKLRAEIARRNQNKQELRQKYNIDEKGNVSLDDLARMFRDLNTNKVLGKLFDKVYNVLKDLGVDFRFTTNLDALTEGRAFAFYNVAFFNWDAMTRDISDQRKATILLHEMIHNVSSHILHRYEDATYGKLSKEQEAIAKELTAIYEAVKKAAPKRKNGKEPYGLKNVHEMIAELANPEFRDILDSIPYNGSTIWQKIKNAILRMLHIDNNTALDSLSKALDRVLDTYNAEGINEYRQQRRASEQEIRDAGVNGDYLDIIESVMNNEEGHASLVEDADLIERLEKEPKITVYRAMQLQDGKLYPPMAAKVNGEWQDPLPLGEWSQADEHPELVDKNGKFTLDKGNGKTVAGVVYAPYMHGSTTMLNDQFKEAQDRPELVVVEAEMPESELTSGYQAEKSPRKTGRLPWKAGTIQGQLTGTRDVILSRWVKPVRIVPASEVAQSIKQMIDGQVEVMPTNVVTPEQREELEKIGVKFVKTNNQEIVQEGEHKGEQYSDAYGKKSKKSKAKRKKSVEGDPMEAIRKAAAKFSHQRAADEGMTPEAHSAKAVYDERLNRVETVFSEAYQDSMVSLKTAQNAIAQDKDIPDSQNAYMAENLMHGKNKNEQDLYNKMFRDPLIATINKIMNLTGINWGDVDRYVYTKSGLERNRELYVRDWLEAERRKTIRRYEDLNDAEQSIFDVLEQRIEEDFDDGKIATEEEKQKKLAQALQKAHMEYVNQIEEEYLGIKGDKFQDMQDGVITFPEYLEAIDNFIRRTIDYGYEPSEHDYSGFRDMFGDPQNGKKYDEAAIIEELMEQEAQMDENPDGEPSGTVAELWEQIRAATRYGLKRYRESGMRSDEQIDRVEQMFHWYVPMRGFKDDMGEDMYQYFTGKGREKSYMGGLLKHAKGRGSEANYPISTIFAMTYKAISDCNQNLVNQKLYRLCQANPNDLIVLSDSWAVFNEATGEWEEVAPEIGDDMDEEEIREATLAWEEDMRQMASDGKAKKITGKAKFDYKPMDKKKQSEHIVDVRINGQPRKMIVTGNPRMAQALNGQLRFERGKNIFSKWNANIKNMMASLFTSYSPTFALRNMFRDWTHFRMMLGVREGHGYAAQANKYYRQSLFKMVGLFKKYREGTLDESKEIERDFKDFMDNGGITGFVQMQKIDDIQKQMEKLYAQQKRGKTIRLNNKVWDYTLGAIEALNEGIENNARFATFRASRHYAGRTKARSAYDAKEITVNFNRKGAGGKTYGFKSTDKRVEDAAKAFGVTSQILGEGRIFFNATVQAIATTFKNFQNADGSLNKGYIARWAAKYALPPFMFGLALPAINKALAAALGGDGDDDPYANLAEWTRRKNICIYIGNNNFITIPIGQELAAFLALGDIAAGNLYAKNIKPVDRSWDDEILGVMNTFSPVDIDTKITKGGITEDPVDEVVGRTFSTLAPLVAVGQNLGWTGRPIYREDKFQNDQYTPEYQMVYQSTNPVLVNASKLLHELGGGDDITRGKLEVNPAIIQYLWEQYTGGPGKVFSNTISIGKDAKDLLSGNETDFNMRKVEGLKAFVQQGDDRTAYYRTQAKYRKYKEDASRLYDAVKGYEGGAAENPEYLLKLEQITKGDDFVRMQIVREADKQLSQINKAANKAEGKEKRELRRLYNEQVAEVVKLLDEVGD